MCLPEFWVRARWLRNIISLQFCSIAISDHLSGDKWPTCSGPTGITGVTGTTGTTGTTSYLPTTSAVTLGPLSACADMAKPKPQYMTTRPRCCATTPDGHYCSSECRTAHRTKHLEDCYAIFPDQVQLSDVIGSAAQEAAQKASTAWATYAATDVINLSRQTEGLAFDGQLNILLSGAFPLRHMIYSVVNLPRTASPRLKFTINATSFFDLQRTFHGLGLLCLSGNDHMTMTAEAMIHMWYSSRLSEDVHEHVQNGLAHIRSRMRKSPGSFLNDPDPTSRCATLEWKQKNIKLTLGLSDEQKSSFHKTVDVAPDLTRLDELCTQYEDRRKDVESFFGNSARMTRSRALGMLMWRVDGSEHPQGSMAEPLSEWPMELLDHPVEDFLAVNDVYGKMFYYLRDLLLQFQIRCQSLQLEIELCCIPPKQLPEYLKVNPEDKFDRIEVSQNRLDGTDKTKTSLGEVWEIFRPTSTILDEYTVTAQDSAWNAAQFPSPKDVARRRVGIQMWENWDARSDRHLHDPKLFGFHLLGQDETKYMESVVGTGFLGLECTRKNRITKRWPNRLIHSRSDKPGIEKFNRFVGWVDNKPQRWLEWQLEEPLDEEELDYWARVCTTMTSEEMRKVMAQAVDEAQESQSRITATTDVDANINLDWIDEDSTGTSTMTLEPEKKPKSKTKGKTKGKKKNGKAKK
ncbi:hypothetical protein E4U55_005718 [Claviceps digitariae]|nr:hypothetical protein E4U55_005718 [Claviceps digitariae]